MRVKKLMALICVVVLTVCMLPSLVFAANDKSAYAVLRDDGVALFYYDNKINDRKYKTFFVQDYVGDGFCMAQSQK